MTDSNYTHRSEVECYETKPKQNLTIFKGASTHGKLQNIAIDNQGAIGMAKMACTRTDRV